MLNENTLRENEWRNILRDMVFYNRYDGYVDEVNGKLTFFDSDPMIDAISAFYVIIDDVKNIINGTYVNESFN